MRLLMGILMSVTILLVGSLLISDLPMPWSPTTSFVDTVTNIQLEQGGFGAKSIAQVTFADGRVMAFPQSVTDKLLIGHTYDLALKEYGQVWNITSISDVTR